MRRMTLMLAALASHVATAQPLLSAGAAFDLRCAGGKSALDWAAGEGNVDVFKLVVEHGADVNSKGAVDITALHVAAISNRAAAIEALVEAGANTEAKRESSGSAPLHAAAISGNLAAVLALLKHGACISQRSLGGLNSVTCCSNQRWEGRNR